MDSSIKDFSDCIESVVKMTSNIILEQTKIRKFEKLIGLSKVLNYGFWEMNSDHEVVLDNRLFYKDFDVDFDNMSLESWTNLIHPDERHSIISEFKAELTGQSNTFKATYRILKKDGEYAWVESISVGDFDDQSKLIGMIGSLTDITEHEETLYQLANYDLLTGLYNENKLIEVSNQLIAQQVKCHVVFIFMYNFFLLQDTFGIEYTTNALVKFGQILKEKFPTGSDIFKLRAQEFVVICYADISHDELIRIFNRAAEETGVEIYKNIKTFYPYLHTGICELPVEGITPRSLIDKSRLTLRYAKKNETGNHTFYNDDIENKITRDIYIETNLRKALKEEELCLKYQPIINTKTHAVDSFEALIRWADKTNGEIYPDEFISISERTGDIVEIGYFVIRETCDFIKRFKSTFGYCPIIAVNVSVVQLLESDFYINVLQILKSKGITPEFITLEITESVTLNKEFTVLTQLNALKREGFGISLDDFGTGYSSLKTLIDVPFTQLKVDKEIVQNLLESESMNRFINSMIMLCHDHNLRVVAEGIEEEKDIDEIMKMDFDLIQGYYYAMPETEEIILKGTNIYPQN